MAPRYIMLFQYGSNMDPDRLNSPARLDGAAETVGVAKLPGWGIRFDLYSQVGAQRFHLSDRYILYLRKQTVR